MLIIVDIKPGVICPQVVYSSSARELKVETVKPDTPEKEEDDIDIDAIWDDDDDAFLVLWLWLTMYHLNNRPPPPLLTPPSPLHPSSALWHDLT